MAQRENIKNLAASVKDRLKQVAQKQNIDFNRVLLLYMQEGFLRRVSLSPYRDKFILKGGILFYGQFEQKARPTRDIDFLLTNTKNNPDRLAVIFGTICRQEAADGIDFDTKSMDITEIKEQADYHGLRAKITGSIGTMVVPLQIDVGFGDVVRPDSIEFEFPVLLDKIPISLKAYSWETVIAEKFEAIVVLSEANSRFKDFYDIYLLSQTVAFQGSQLALAIGETFSHRGTDLKGYHSIFQKQFINDPTRVQMWTAFRTKMRFLQDLEFSQLMRSMESFLSPVIQALLENEKFTFRWNVENNLWM
jgi:predicted nucleotidyltransferase component of viral defense system